MRKAPLKCLPVYCTTQGVCLPSCIVYCSLNKSFALPVSFLSSPYILNNLHLHFLSTSSIQTLSFMMSFFARLNGAVGKWATSSRIHKLFYTAVKVVNKNIAQFGKDESNPDTMYLLAGNTLVDELRAVTTTSRPQSKRGKMRSAPSQTSSLADSSP